jgi:hypothetical protein
MKRKTLVTLAAGAALLLAGCGGGSSSSTSTSAANTSTASTASQSSPAPSGATAAPGASFAVGQAATVRFTPLSSSSKTGSTLKVTVESLQQGTLADFNGIQLDASQKAGTPDYVTVTITNMGPGQVKSSDAGADIQGVDNTGNTQQSVTFIGTFPKCNDVSSDALIAPGHAMHTCLTFLVPGGIKKVAYTGTQDYIGSPVTWSAK